MTENLHFYTVEELKALSIEELQALWDLVPTDRQRAYRQAYMSAGYDGILQRKMWLIAFVRCLICPLSTCY